MGLGSRQVDFASDDYHEDPEHTQDACLEVVLLSNVVVDQVEHIVKDHFMGIDLVAYEEVNQYVVDQTQVGDAFPLEVILELQEDHLVTDHFVICQMGPFITIDTSIIKGCYWDLEVLYFDVIDF